MKKHSLVKVLLAILVLVVITTYFVAGRDGVVDPIAIGDVVVNFVQSFYYFFDTAIFILVVGGFYGLLNKTKAYRRLLDTIASKIKDNRKKVVLGTTVLFAVISALTGLDMLLFVFIPFVVSLILLLGYDKLVALSSTVGAVLVGFIGGIFTTVKDSTGASTFETLVGLDDMWANVVPKVLLLIVVVALLVLYVSKHIDKLEKNGSEYELSSNDALLIETKDKNGKVVKAKYDDVMVWPIVTIFIIMFVLFVLGFMPWNALFEVTVFSEFHAWITGFTFADLHIGVLVLLVLALLFTIYRLVNVKTTKGMTVCKGLLVTLEIVMIVIFSTYAFDLKLGSFSEWVTEWALWDSSVFTTILSGSFYEFGEWSSLGNFMMPIVIMVFFGIVIKFVYKIKLDSAIDSVVIGAKKMLPSAIIAMLAYSILVSSYNNGFIETIITNVSELDNVVINALITVFGSITNVDLYYTTAGVFSPIVSALSDTANLNIYAMAFQGLYGLVNLVGPTSLLLIVGLTYLDVPYKTWVKYIWRFILALFIVVFLAMMIVSLL